MSNTSDFSKPQTTDTYVNVTAEVQGLVNDLAQGLDPATTNPANTPTNAVRWNSANGFWEKFSGTTWAALASVYNIVAAQAVKLKTAVTVAIGGDVSGSASFDGSQNVTITATLPNVNSNAGTAGSATTVPVIITNSKGLVTSVSSVPIGVTAADTANAAATTAEVTRAESAESSISTSVSTETTRAEAAESTNANAVAAEAARAKAAEAALGTISWSNISGRPTDLGSFSNNPGYTNGGGGATNCAKDAGSTANCNCSFGGGIYAAGYSIAKSGANYVLYGHNCNCNCCCCC